MARLGVPSRDSDRSRCGLELARVCTAVKFLARMVPNRRRGDTLHSSFARATVLKSRLNQLQDLGTFPRAANSAPSFTLGCTLVLLSLLCCRNGRARDAWVRSASAGLGRMRGASVACAAALEAIVQASKHLAHQVLRVEGKLVLGW